MKKAAIIAKTLADMKNISSDGELSPAGDLDDEKTAIQTLDAKLSEFEPDRDIRTCSDFSHIHTECCEICHTFSPLYEMSLLDLEGGGKAWICCAMNRALNPQKHSPLASSAAYKTPAAMLGMVNYDEWWQTMGWMSHRSVAKGWLAGPGILGPYLICRSVSPLTQPERRANCCRLRFDWKPDQRGV